MQKVTHLLGLVLLTHLPPKTAEGFYLRSSYCKPRPSMSSPQLQWWLVQFNQHQNWVNWLMYIQFLGVPILRCDCCPSGRALERSISIANCSIIIGKVRCLCLRNLQKMSSIIYKCGVFPEGTDIIQPRKKVERRILLPRGVSTQEYSVDNTDTIGGSILCLAIFFMSFLETYFIYGKVLCAQVTFHIVTVYPF